MKKSDEAPVPLVPDGLDYIEKNYGRKIDRASAYRWWTAGLLAADGQRVRLRTIRVGRYRHVTPAAIDEFFAELTERDDARHRGKHEHDNRRNQQHLLADAILKSDSVGGGLR